jgi:large subunit ribosomal protein L29
MANKIEVQKLNTEELKGELSTLQSHLQSLQYRNAITPLANGSEIPATRRQIARVLTELRGRELAELAKTGNLKRDKLTARRRRMKKA